MPRRLLAHQDNSHLDNSVAQIQFLLRKEYRDYYIARKIKLNDDLSKKNMKVI